MILYVGQGLGGDATGELGLGWSIYAYVPIILRTEFIKLKSKLKKTI